MTDGFLATVKSYDSDKNTAVVSPLFVEYDGTDHPDITVKPVAGITPEEGDTALVLTIRNNLDDETISRYFEASESNGRIIDIVKPKNGVFIFTGDYKFVGDMTFDGDVHVTGDTVMDGNLEVKGDTTLDGNLEVKGDTTLDGKLHVKGDATLDSDLEVKGDTTLDGDLHVKGDAKVDGDSTLLGKLDVTGVTTLGGIIFGTHTHISNIAGLPTGPPI